MSNEYSERQSKLNQERIDRYIAGERKRFEAWEKLQMRADNQGFTLFDIWLAAKEDVK